MGHAAGYEAVRNANESRDANPHHFNADPNPAFHYNADPDPATHQSARDHRPMDPPVPEIIDPVFAKTSRKRSFCMTENERFGLVFGKTRSINSGTGLHFEHTGLHF
jgi:hypothetical protein